MYRKSLGGMVFPMTANAYFNEALRLMGEYQALWAFQVCRMIVGGGRLDWVSCPLREKLTSFSSRYRPTGTT
jgi:hypothetical protein